MQFALFFRPNLNHSGMRKLSIFILPLALLLFSCNHGSRFKIDTKDNRVEVKIHRFDKDLILLDSTNSTTNIKSLYQKYPQFLPTYTSEILNVESSNAQAISRLIYKYNTDTTFSNVNKKVIEQFNDISDIEKSVSDSYTYIHHYFPGVKLPEVYFYVSGFNRSVMMTESFIAFGTDLYLGSDYPLYKDISYDYLLTNMRRECLATDIVSTTLFRMFTLDSSKDRLLDNMIFRGKVMYLLSVFMPNEKPEDLMGYTTDQWKWCKTYEKEIWGSVLDHKDLFSTNSLLINKYLNDAPFTAPVSQDSPGRLGTWLGWQIVESYMNKNTNVDLKGLMDENNFQKILEESGFRP